MSAERPRSEISGGRIGRRAMQDNLGPLTRRKALGLALSGLAAGLEADTRKRLGAAIIGTAHPHSIGHLEAIRISENYHFVSAAEPNARLLEKAKSDPRWQGVRWTSIDEILGDASIDLVCVETDPLDSLRHALASVQAGKHTKIDKPPGANIELLELIFDKAQSRDVVVQMGYVYRYNPAFRLARRAITETWLGPIRSVVIQMNDTQTPESRKRLDRYPGGQMFGICSHMVDALVWMFGEPSRVSSVLRRSKPELDDFEDDVLATFEYDWGVVALRSHTRDSERYIHFFGEDGSIQIDQPDRPEVRLVLSEDHAEFGRGAQHVPVGPSQRYVPDLDALAGAVREGRWVEHFSPDHDLAVQRTLLKSCGVETL